jgi:hypothetical protein
VQFIAKADAGLIKMTDWSLDQVPFNLLLDGSSPSEAIA